MSKQAEAAHTCQQLVQASIFLGDVIVVVKTVVIPEHNLVQAAADTCLIWLQLLIWLQAEGCDVSTFVPASYHDKSRAAIGKVCCISPSDIIRQLSHGKAGKHSKHK